MYKNDGSEEKVAAKNILIATGSEVTPFRHNLLIKDCFSLTR